VSLLLRHQRQPDAGVAGGALDQDVAGLDVAAGLGRLDHAQAEAVLDRAPGILRFELEVELTHAGVEVLGRDDRRGADQVEYGGVNGHAAARSLAADSAADPAILTCVAGARLLAA